MYYPEIDQQKRIVKSFIANSEDGIFLTNLLPRSVVTLYHSFGPEDTKSYNIFIVGEAQNLKYLNVLIGNHLIDKSFGEDGVWRNVAPVDNKLIVSYRYKKNKTADDIIKLLSLEFRNDIIQSCGLSLLPCSWIIIKKNQRIGQPFKVPLTPEQKVLNYKIIIAPSSPQ